MAITENVIIAKKVVFLMVFFGQVTRVESILNGTSIIYVLLWNAFPAMNIMQNRFIRNVSSNTVQLVINQLFGLLIFYALSKGLDKNIFGQVSWSLAVLLTVFGVLSFGIDQVMVKKIAAGEGRQSIFTAYLFHVIFTGCLFYGSLLILYFIFPGIFSRQQVLLFIGIGKLLIFFSTPFKQLANGLEKFRVLLYMSVVSNIVRGTGLLWMSFTNSMSVNNVLLIFIVGDLAELLVCSIAGSTLLERSSRIRWDKKIHFLLLKESLPQAGVVAFSSIMGRLDWILIGVLVSSNKLAEYSFAYKVFEVSTLPLLIIGPILLPLFARIFQQNSINGKAVREPSFLLEWQITLASFMALLLNVCWVPVIDLITDGKYGTVNAKTIFILSASMPFLYLNNYLWTINFSKSKLKLIFYIMTATFAVNLVGCSILIPVLYNEGAAIAYLITIFIQSVIYFKVTPISMPVARRYRLMLWPAVAFGCGLIAHEYFTNKALAIALPLFIYVGIVFISRQFRGKDWKTLQALYQ